MAKWAPNLSGIKNKSSFFRVANEQGFFVYRDKVVKTNTKKKVFRVMLEKRTFGGSKSY